MQMIIEARLVDDVQETARIQLAVIDREMTTSPLGLSLAEGAPTYRRPRTVGWHPGRNGLDERGPLGLHLHPREAESDRSLSSGDRSTVAGQLS